VLLICAGLGLFAGRLWARLAGVAVAGLSALADLVFVTTYPFWSLTVIFLDILIIYAITVHGGERNLDE
jgi:hypothetical protein